jgi:hypothetical protein
VREIFREWEAEPREGHLLATIPKRQDEDFCRELLDLRDVEVITLNKYNWDEVGRQMLMLKPQLNFNIKLI